LRRPRAREVGISFGVLPPGPRNMISDVAGVRVGHTTLVRGSGPLKEGFGPVRTGVTVIVPHEGNLYRRPVKASYFDLNGCGGLVGALQIREFGMIDTPIGLTNTMSMGVVADALVKHVLRANPNAAKDQDAVIPVVSECDDSFLNDSRGMHVLGEHVHAALERVTVAVEEGAVGAGTGMSCYEFKGGIGTSSRIVETPAGRHTLGTLVLSNHGEREELVVLGVPVGRLLGPPTRRRREQGSIVMVVATDAPVSDRQLQRLARRAPLGLARTGACSHSGSGDIVIAFSTANVHDRMGDEPIQTDHFMRDRDLDHLFRATVDSTEESIVNSLFKADTTEGRDGNVSHGLPLDETIELLKEHKCLG
jgi:D-aminopeptidase